MNMGILTKGESSSVVENSPPTSSSFYNNNPSRKYSQEQSSNNNNNIHIKTEEPLKEDKFSVYEMETSTISTPLHSGESPSLDWNPYHHRHHPQSHEIQRLETDAGGMSSSLTSSGTPLCAGCRLRIIDEFYLCSVEKKWHASCLRCSECGGELEDQASCFEKEGHIYCKEDFLRMQSSRTCSKCHMEIRSSDLVMKAKDSLFHVECFRCSSCDLTLVKGDLFGMCNDLVFCKDHYEEEEEEDDEEEELGGGGGGEDVSGDYYPNRNPLYHHNPSHARYEWGNYEGGWYNSAAGGPVGDYGPPPPHHIHHHHPSEFPFENNNKPPSASFKKRRGRKKRAKMITAEGFTAEGYGSTEFGSSGAGLDPACLGAGNQPKTKRARTSFKHHQLRIMKAHFQINQNPDSRELKMLSQKTGLDKKVLQVWFQNSRAKWRRTKVQDGLPSTATEDPSLVMGDASSPASDCSGNGPLIPCC